MHDMMCRGKWLRVERRAWLVNPSVVKLALREVKMLFSRFQSKRLCLVLLRPQCPVPNLPHLSPPFISPITHIRTRPPLPTIARRIRTH